MIDIWMLFTLTVPFLEVVLHTMNEVFKKSTSTSICQNNRVDVVNVKPAKDQELVEEIKTSNNILNMIASLMLPVSSLIFAFIFWTIGLIASYSDANITDPNMPECLYIQPD